MENQSWKFTKREALTVLVVALGYYVDAYDLLVMSAVRKSSLISLGIPESETLNIGLSLLNYQLVGLMIGGVIWGIIADKYGRRRALFGSILLYSFANIANSFVTSVDMYYLLRLIAGFGLAGELGVGISLITESVSKEKRTISTAIVSFFGMLGAATGGWFGTLFDWHNCFLIGGLAGLFLLLLRLQIRESVLFNEIKIKNISKGNLWTIIKNPKMLLTYFFCTLSGASSFLFIGMFIQSTPEFGKIFDVNILAGTALIWYYLGASISEIIAGVMSKVLKERKATIYIFYSVSLLAVTNFCIGTPQSSYAFYLNCLFLGFGLGWWSQLITLSAELFGTNIRATAATSIPTFARAWNIPLSNLFKQNISSLGIVNSAFGVGILTIALAMISITMVKETFENDANFVNE